MRLSEESDSNTTSKDIVRSQSTSDCEAAMKDDQQPQHKKVQRYSERSKNRKARRVTTNTEPLPTENSGESPNNVKLLSCTSNE